MSMTMEIQEGRGVGELNDHIHLHLEHLGPEVINERLPGIVESAEISQGLTSLRSPSQSYLQHTTWVEYQRITMEKW